MDAYIEIVKMYNDFLSFALVKVVDKKFCWKSFQYLILATGNSINFEVKKAANLRDIFFMMEFFYYFKYSIENFLLWLVNSVSICQPHTSQNRFLLRQVLRQVLWPDIFPSHLLIWSGSIPVSVSCIFFNKTFCSALRAVCFLKL